DLVIGFVKVPFVIPTCTAEMHKVYAVTQTAYHARKIVVGPNTIRSCAEAKSVRGSFIGIEQLPCIGLGTQHPGQPEDRIWRIIRVDGQFDSYLIGNRTDRRHKLVEVSAQPLVINV